MGDGSRGDDFAVTTPFRDRGLRSKLALIVGGGWALYTLLYLCKVFFYFDIVIYSLVHRAICAGCITILCFLVLPPKKGQSREELHWYDILPIIAIIAGAGYVVLHAETFVYHWGDANALEMVIGISFILCLVEATRRTVGLPVSLIVIAAFFYVVYSNYFPGFLMSVGLSYPRAVGWMYLSGEGLWGTIIGVVSTIVSGFIIFGGLLKATGASTFFNDLAFGLVGSLRGGPAKAAVVGSTFFGTISGSIAANVATTGQVTIPLMMKNGYRANLAGAIEATASTGGMFTPPIMGATAFLIAEFLEISYWKVCLAAAIPAGIYYLVLFVQVDLEAAKVGAKGLPRSELPSVRATLARGWQYLVPFAALLFFLGGLQYSAETSIVYTLWILIAASFVRKESRLTVRKAIIALEESARGMMVIVPLCTAIGILVGAMTITGAGANLSVALLELSGGVLFFMLLMTAVASFILGMGMTAITCYILTVVLIAPGLISAGVEPMAAHLFLFYFGCLSFITPPVAVAAYIAAGISGGDPWRTGFQAVRLGIAAFLVPWAMVYNPELVLVGSTWEIIEATVFVSMGAMLVAVALSGFFFGFLPAYKRILFGALGVGLFMHHIAYWYVVALVAILVIGLHWWSVRRKEAYPVKGSAPRTSESP